MCLVPPDIKGVGRLQGKSGQPITLQDNKPKLSCEHTSNKKMLDALILLITKRTLFGMGEATPSQSIRCPTMIVSNQPYKEAAFWGRPSFPNALIQRKTNGFFKEYIIGRFDTSTSYSCTMVLSQNYDL